MCNSQVVDPCGHTALNTEIQGSRKTKVYPHRTGDKQILWKNTYNQGHRIEEILVADAIVRYDVSRPASKLRMKRPSEKVHGIDLKK